MIIIEHKSRVHGMINRHDTLNRTQGTDNEYFYNNNNNNQDYRTVDFLRLSKKKEHNGTLTGITNK